MTALRAVSPDSEPGELRPSDYLRDLQATAPAGDRTVLLAFARTWGDLLQALVHTGKLPVGRAIEVLLGAVRDAAHPAADRSVVFLMPPLVEAVSRRDALDSGQLDPRDVVDDDVVWTSRFEIAAQQLDREVEQALHPLLYGLPAGA